MRFNDLEARAAKVWQDFVTPRAPVILVGDGTCGRAAGSADIIAAIEDELAKQDAEAEIVRVGCLGLCYAEPLVEVRTPGGPSVLYSEVTPDVARKLVAEHVKKGEPLIESVLAAMPGGSADGVPRFEDLPAMRGQVRLVTRNCGRVDPGSLDHYVATGGYKALARAVTMPPEDVIAEVEKSGLRGRGGAGFPTGRKWRFAREAPGDRKHVICNADEGDPGAFMDRTLLESDPHAVLEGLAIAAYAIGAGEAIVYCRAEYPLAIERLLDAIAQTEAAGLLGDDVLGSGFGLHVKIKEGAGAFVCGEETALIASIHGRRGMPRVRPPFPAQKGLFDRPTNINNVETFANVPAILRDGAESFRKHGTESSPGTKTFALAGKVERTGLVEVPMGISLREIIFDIGGGVPDGKRFKAAQTGGPSGGCLPELCLDLPVDYDALAEADSIMGSGGLIVMDEDTCVPDVARYFVAFTKEESCGKCAPCRLGTWQMKALLDDVCSGAADADTLAVLGELAESIKVSALCGLGQTAPNPVLTTIRYFEDEYLAHVNGKRCPARVCKALIRFRVDEGKCKGCGACIRACAAGAITGEKKKVHTIDQDLCVSCGACNDVCKFDAVIVE
ncbi:MAG: NADH-ubiquinone oxidoreductase-F iron-sulfur binding region domain-containing protein [Planctomycetota bacterium]|jgi:NADH:ubiquinone oxidoreductase subunit F (NADH-binding)/(2Fe-2S) ferredoxin/NAD-dependent dihydropyrimidine dehydrogenase PreA subunit